MDENIERRMKYIIEAPFNSIKVPIFEKVKMQKEEDNISEEIVERIVEALKDGGLINYVE